MRDKIRSINFHDLIGNKKLLYKSNILFTITTLEDTASFHEEFNKIGFKVTKIDQDGLISYKIPSDVKSYKPIKIGFDEEYKLGIFVTKWRKSIEIPKKLENPLRFAHNIAQLWIKPLILDKMLEELKEKYHDLNVTWFSGISDPKYFKGIRRPQIKRSIQYSGEDGFNTLEEMREDYGIMPKIVSFNIPNIGSYRIDNRGIVTVYKGNLNPIYNTIIGAMEEMQDWLKSFNQSIITTYQKKLSDYSVNIRGVYPWKIKLDRPLFSHEIKSFEHRIWHEENLFSTMNQYIKKDKDESISNYYSLYLDETNYTSFGVEFFGKENIFSVYPHDKSLPSMVKFVNAIHDYLETDIKAA